MTHPGQGGSSQPATATGSRAQPAATSQSASQPARQPALNGDRRCLWWREPFVRGRNRASHSEPSTPDPFCLSAASDGPGVVRMVRFMIPRAPLFGCRELGSSLSLSATLAVRFPCLSLQNLAVFDSLDHDRANNPGSAIAGGAKSCCISYRYRYRYAQRLSVAYVLCRAKQRGRDFCFPLVPEEPCRRDWAARAP